MCFFVLFLLPSSNPQKTGNGTHRSLFPFLYPFICLFLHGRHNALCQTGKALNFRRNDDLGGLTVAYDALQKALADTGKSGDDKIDGYTENQRFFMNWATVWRRNFTPEELKNRIATDEHAPAQFRAIGAPSNLPTFAAAFSCKPGDAMVRTGDQQVVIW